MTSALTRRGLVVAGLPIAALAGAAGGMVTQALAERALTFARIDAAERRCTEAKRAFEAALAAYGATMPRPHWSIDYDRRDRALCAVWANAASSFPGGPRFLPDNRGLEDDYHAFWRTNRDDPDACRAYGRLTRRLKVRVARYKARVAAHEQHHRLRELEGACAVAKRDMDELAREVFARPASSMEEILVQARVLQAFGTVLSGQQDWSAVQAGLFGRQIADSLCQLERAA